MTAEVLIMNRSGVALAADSAVTIGNGSGAKIYNTVNKVFTLSKYHPVGVMIHDAADYMSVPWETVIKLYREQRGNRPFGTVKQYAQDFLRFVARAIPVTREDEADRVFQIWVEYFDQLNFRIHNFLLETREEQKRPLTNTEVTTVFREMTRIHVQSIRRARTLPQYRSIAMPAIHRRFASQFDSAKLLAFPGRKITRAIDNALREYAALILVKENFAFGASGLVFAGFGEKEIFPSMYAVMCSGKLLGRLKLPTKPLTAEVTSSFDQRVHIYAFAQREMVGRYMDGIDPDYSEYISAGVSQLVERLTELLIDKYGTAVAKKTKVKAAKRTALRMAQQFERNAEQFRYHEHQEPTLTAVSTLPKEDLAELAGALVNITSLKRKFAMDRETVGGPIDVAVISKGDGFIWIDRKHYFKPELNPAFLQNYLSR